MPNQNEPKLKNKADIVFLLDITGSMAPCIDDLKSNIDQLSDSFEGTQDVEVDWRARMIGYRDFEADSETDKLVGRDNPMVSSSAELKQQVRPFEAAGGGGGIEEIPESALDAIEFVIENTDWVNIGEGHRIIVLLTDAPTKSTTVSGLDLNDIVQKLQEEHIKILLYGPPCTEFKMIGKLAKADFTDVSNDGKVEIYEGLRNFNWDRLFETLNSTVSTAVEPVTPSPAPSPSGSTTGPVPIPPPSASSGGKTVPM